MKVKVPLATDDLIPRGSTWNSRSDPLVKRWWHKVNFPSSFLKQASAASACIELALRIDGEGYTGVTQQESSSLDTTLARIDALRKKIDGQTPQDLQNLSEELTLVTSALLNLLNEDKTADTMRSESGALRDTPQVRALIAEALLLLKRMSSELGLNLSDLITHND